MGRLNMPALVNSTMKTFLELASRHGESGSRPSTGLCGRRDTKRCSGTWILSDPKVSGHIKSMNLSFAAVDEASEVSEEIYWLIEGRVRRKGVNRRAIRLTSNPAGHDWMWRTFFDPERSEKLKTNHLGITATTFQNIHLPQGGGGPLGSDVSDRLGREVSVWNFCGLLGPGV